MSNSTILACGSFLPKDRQFNSDLERQLGLESGWIESRTGILSRAIANPDDAVSDLALRAGKDALEKYDATGKPLANIKTLILATSTPDHLLPPTSAQVAFQLGLGNIAAMDLTVACSGFLYGLKLADSLCQTTGESVIVIAANILSRRCKIDDIKTRPIFGDAAGALVLGPSNDASGIIGSAWESDGSQWQNLMIRDGGSRHPIDADTFTENRHLMDLREGTGVFKYAVQTMSRLGRRAISQAGLDVSDIDWWIPHQASLRIIMACQRNLSIAPKKILTTVQDVGNSSAATIPVTLDKFLYTENGIRPNDLVLMTAAAVGMTGAAVLVRMP